MPVPDEQKANAAVAEPEELEGDETFGVDGFEDDPNYGQPDATTETETTDEEPEERSDDGGEYAEEDRPTETSAQQAARIAGLPGVDAEGRFEEPYLGKYQTVQQALEALSHSSALIGQKETELQRVRDDAKRSAELARMMQENPDELIARAEAAKRSQHDRALDEAVEMQRDPAGFIAKHALRALTAETQKTEAIKTYRSQLQSHYDGVLGAGNWGKASANREAIRRDFFGYVDPSTGQKVNPRGGLDELLHLAAIGRNVRDAKLAGGPKPTKDEALIVGPSSGATRAPSGPPSSKGKKEMTEEEQVEALLDARDDERI